MSVPALRIAQIAPVGTATGPDVGESVEHLVWLLTEELVARGHHVTLFATGDSHTSAELEFLFARGYEHDEELWDWHFTESMHAAHAYARARDFDVIHCHAPELGLPLTPFVATGNVHTAHVELAPAVLNCYRCRPQVALALASRSQQLAGGLAGLPNVSVIPHGLDIAAFPFGPGGGDYLLFLGRLIPDKGPLEAVAIARAAGMRLIIAGPTDELLDFDRELAPLVDGRDVVYVGRVAPRERDRLLAGAAALVYPLRYPEPFGLVMVEAMACGTPVLAVATGAVPEIVDLGVTGFTAARWEDLAGLVPAVRALDRRAVRARAAKRFAFDAMTDAYERLYARLAAEVRSLA